MCVLWFLAYAYVLACRVRHVCALASHAPVISSDELELLTQHRCAALPSSPRRETAGLPCLPVHSSCLNLTLKTLNFRCSDLILVLELSSLSAPPPFLPPSCRRHTTVPLQASINAQQESRPSSALTPQEEEQEEDHLSSPFPPPQELAQISLEDTWRTHASSHALRFVASRLHPAPPPRPPPPLPPPLRSRPCLQQLLQLQHSSRQLRPR